MVDELSHGIGLKPAVKYQKISTSKGVPRDNH
jgi:dihydroxy-acid dehydratase